MKITKFAHCCLLIEERGVRILIDPGFYSADAVKDLQNIHVILITHDHHDHLFIDSLKIILEHNPEAFILTNTGTGISLTNAGIKFELLEDGGKKEYQDVLIEGFGKDHAIMHTSIPCSPNTGYFIADKFFFPGDSLIKPNKPVDILALPVAGPWMKLPEGIDYALEVKPRVCFPVHEGNVNYQTIYRLPKQVLEPQGIKFLDIEKGKEIDL